jgi:GT2 family glycosyltransferase
MSGPAPTSRGLASIIVPCFNQLAYTRLCIAALAKHTRGPWELVAVDNGSTDGTAEYLAGVRDVAPFPVTIVSNARNLGFPAACNQGLAQARGSYLVLLNNDAVVTAGWLDQLTALADSEPSIGMTGPVSNYAPPPQLLSEATYSNLDQMHQFAARWRRERRGKWLKASKLSGFCLLIKRAVLDKVGMLDERFGLGLFDDDDLSLRVRHAGFALAVALDLFVHHFGNRTFVGAGIDTKGLLAANLAQFTAKWGADTPSFEEVTLTPRVGVPAAPDSRLLHTNGEPARRAWSKLFGIGLPRTGTTSVAAAMMELGLKTCHACFDDTLYDQGDAFFDTPV